MNAILSFPAAQVAPAHEAENDTDFERRFGGIARLYGRAALERFRNARVCVVGVGGVGSWVVEALARSAIGAITMIDLDNVAESNINRQIHALNDTLGKAKVTALAERIAQINPICAVTEIEDFVSAENLDAFIGAGRFDYVVDAIDSVAAKTALIVYCRNQGIPLVTIGGAGGQTDPTRIEVRDLARTEQEPLLAKVRKRLRSQHGFPRGDKSRFGIEAVFSTEPLRTPEPSCAIGEAGEGGVTGLNCAGFGSSMAVTASFGLVAASRVLRVLADQARSTT
ncbi:MAG TPA: tRNA cyclic N6-threonylcarbamoyladenosine(37) synthase TcdA [Noviherbaspirillum sp.]